MQYAQVAVVIPALNEEASLPLVLAELPAVGIVFVVDNGSRDATAAVAVECGASVIAQPRRGYGNACLAGIAAAHRWGAELIVITDADRSTYGGDLPRLVDPILDDRADLVLGDRTHGAEPGALTPAQRWGNRLATTLIARSTGHRYADMGPYRAVRARSLQTLDMSDPTYGWNVQMQMRAVQRHLRILEVPVRARPRAAGQSTISGSVRGTIAAGVKIVASTVRYSRD